MSFSVVNSVTKAATKILSGCARNKTSAKVSSILASQRLSQIGPNRPLTRSLWYMSSKSSPDGGAGASARQKPLWSLSCGCGLHTEGDQQLVQYLKEEIKLEKDSQTKVPSIAGWESTLDGADVILKKKHDNETIAVKFNVNNTVDSEFPEDPQQNEDLQMTSLPPFTVEISKGGVNSLSLHCSFPVNQGVHDQHEEQHEDAFEIEEISLSPGEVNEQTYTMSGSVMDGNLYDLLMNMLDERGVDEEFAQKLVEFSTSYEHKCYVKFLDELKDFVIEK